MFLKQTVNNSNHYLSAFYFIRVLLNSLKSQWLSRRCYCNILLQHIWFAILRFLACWSITSDTKQQTGIMEHYKPIDHLFW